MPCLVCGAIVAHKFVACGSIFDGRCDKCRSNGSTFIDVPASGQIVRTSVLSEDERKLLLDEIRNIAREEMVRIVTASGFFPSPISEIRKIIREELAALTAPGQGNKSQYWEG